MESSFKFEALSKMRTCFFCPILWALACACRSFCGFQSESNITTVSADAKLIPNPPALVDSKKQKSCNHKTRNSLFLSLTNVTNSNKPWLRNESWELCYTFPGRPLLIKGQKYMEFYNFFFRKEIENKTENVILLLSKCGIHLLSWKLCDI